MSAVSGFIEVLDEPGLLFGGFDALSLVQSHSGGVAVYRVGCGSVRRSEQVVDQFVRPAASFELGGVAVQMSIAGVGWHRRPSVGWSFGRC